MSKRKSPSAQFGVASIKSLLYSALAHHLRLGSPWAYQRRLKKLSSSESAQLITMIKPFETTFAQDFLKFVDASPSPYHAAESVAGLLRNAGFVAISEAGDWSSGILKPGGRYFFTRGGSSIVAFAIPETIESPAFTIIGAHTDSPVFKIKPISQSSTLYSHKFLQVHVEPYGGMLVHTWFDRDLGLAGRVFIRDAASGNLSVRTVHIAKPILRIPNLAIHLSRGPASNGFVVDKERHTVPILATKIAAEALNIFPGAAEANSKSEANLAGVDKTTAAERHSSVLLELLSKELGVSAHEIVDLDLCLADTQPAAIGGACDEFILSPRLDNLASCFTSVRALIKSLEEDSASSDSIRMVSMYDHEEVGSTSANGADSPVLAETMQRIISAVFSTQDYFISVRKSFLISADMAHSVHPNYADKHEARHQPSLGSGLIIKTNANQRYATTGLTGFLIREIARRAGGLPIEEFVVPNGAGCGSTIGPAISSRTGLRTVDGKYQRTSPSMTSFASRICAPSSNHSVESSLLWRILCSRWAYAVYALYS
jgi:aspartyl aminopeptidase